MCPCLAKGGGLSRGRRQCRGRGESKTSVGKGDIVGSTSAPLKESRGNDALGQGKYGLESKVRSSRMGKKGKHSKGGGGRERGEASKKGKLTARG